MLPVSCFRLFLVIIFHCLRRGGEPKSLPASFLIEMRCLSIARELVMEEGEGAGHSDWGMCQHLFLLSDLGKTFYPALLLLSLTLSLPTGCCQPMFRLAFVLGIMVRQHARHGN